MKNKEPIEIVLLHFPAQIEVQHSGIAPASSLYIASYNFNIIKMKSLPYESFLVSFIRMRRNIYLSVLKVFLCFYKAQIHKFAEYLPFSD